jgi:hypothetical protein
VVPVCHIGDTFDPSFIARDPGGTIPDLSEWALTATLRRGTVTIPVSVVVDDVPNASGYLLATASATAAMAPGEYALNIRRENVAGEVRSSEIATIEFILPPTRS